MEQDASRFDGTDGEQEVAPPPSQVDLDALYAAYAARIFSGGTSGELQNAPACCRC